MPLETQLGTKDESTYGTPVTVDRFEPFISENIQPETFRTRVPTLRSGKQTSGSTEYAAGILGYAGSIEIPALSKGFGLWLTRALGASTTAGPTGAAYQHTAVIDPDACPPFFSAQVNRAFAPCAATDQAMSFEGCQIASWSLECSVDDILKFSCDIVAEDGTTGTALASASYSVTEPLTWAGSSLTIGGTSVPVTSVTLSGDNKLKTDRHYQRANTRRDKAPRSDYPEITIEFEADWDSTTQYDRFVAETAAGTQAAVVWTVEAPTIITTGYYPGIAVTLAAVDFTEVAANVSGPEMMMQSISGLVVDNFSAEPISAVYTTEDTTP